MTGWEYPARPRTFPSDEMATDMLEPPAPYGQDMPLAGQSQSLILETTAFSGPCGRHIGDNSMEREC